MRCFKTLFPHVVVSAKQASTALPTCPSCARTTSTMTSWSRLGNMPCSVLFGKHQKSAFLYQTMLYPGGMSNTHSTTNLTSLALAFLPSSASTLARLSASRSARASWRSSSVRERSRAVLLLLALPGKELVFVVGRGGTGGGDCLSLLLLLLAPSSEKIRPMLERGFWMERSRPPTASNSSSCMPVP
jgi:hypothetical protein